MQLINCQTGTMVIIQDLALDQEVLDRLLNMGLYKECIVSVVLNVIHGIIIETKGTRVALNKQVAQDIKVKYV